MEILHAHTAALVMMNPATCSTVEVRRDGRPVEIRAALLAAVGLSSSQSLYRRFFAMKRGFTEQKIAFSQTSTSSAMWPWSR